MPSNKGRWNKRLKKNIPVGSLVKVNIVDRIQELGIIIDANYGLIRNSWYLIYGLSSGKQYYAYPNEIIWLGDLKAEKINE